MTIYEDQAFQGYCQPNFKFQNTDYFPLTEMVLHENPLESFNCRTFRVLMRTEGCGLGRAELNENIFDVVMR